MSYAKELAETLSDSEITKMKVNDMTEYQRGQYNMLNRVMILVQHQLLKELTL